MQPPCRLTPAQMIVCGLVLPSCVSVVYSAEKTKSCLRISHSPEDQTHAATYVVRSRNGDAVLERMPAHMQDLLVEINCIRIRLLAHPRSLTSWTVCSAVALLVLAASSVHRCRDANLLRLERALICLQYNLSVLADF